MPAILLALATGGITFFLVPPGYEDSTQVLFIGSPNQPGEKVQSNPYLSLSSTLVSTADVIRLTVTTAQTAQALADQGATAFYDVSLDQSTPAPVLLVTTKASDPAIARRTGTAVVAEIARLLQDVQQQAGAPRSTWVATTVISQLPEPARKLNQSLRPAIGATVGVLALTLFGLFLLEGRRRTGSASRRRPSEPGSAANLPGVQGHPAAQAYPAAPAYARAQAHPAGQAHASAQAHPSVQMHPSAQAHPAAQAYPAQAHSAAQAYPATQAHPAAQAYPAARNPPAAQAHPSPMQPAYPSDQTYPPTQPAPAQPPAAFAPASAYPAAQLSPRRPNRPRSVTLPAETLPAEKLSAGKLAAEKQQAEKLPAEFEPAEPEGRATWKP